jgi:Carboxypeptidase regulatory-like domain
MLTPRLLPGSLSLLLLAFTLQPAHAQIQTTYRIAGTVVSAVDKHSLQRAALQITNTDNPKQVLTTTSDEYGRFAFTKLPAGNFELQGSAPNYLATLYDEHEGFSTGIITGAAVDTESLILKLQPESTIGGTVVNEAAEPVENAAIRLFLQSHAFGDGRLVPAGTGFTDDRGRFELPHLKAGTYFIAVSASPWYAVHPLPQYDPPPPPRTQSSRAGQQQQQRAPAGGIADAIDPTLDVAYATDFYPGTTDSAHAQPITLRGGDSLELHFQLSPQAAVSVTIPRVLKPGQPDVPPQLRMSIFGQLESPPPSVMRQSPTATVIAGLAPGDYILSDSRNLNQPHGGTPLHLAERNTEATPASASGLAHVHVIARTADGSAAPSDLWVALIHPHSADMVSAQVNPKGEVSLDAPPGDYYFQVVSGDKDLFPRQVLSGDQPLTDPEFHLAADASRFFTITYSEGKHTLKGMARKDGKGFPGAFILLFPTSEAADPHTFFRQQSDLDGSFSIQGVAPGAYTLLAIDGGWDLDWQHNNALARFLPAAQKIGIPDSAEKTHYLTQALVVQQR